jgi:hypothetical protein
MTTTKPRPEVSSLISSDRRQVLKTAAILGAAGALGKIGLAPITPAKAQSAKPIDYQIFNVEPTQLQSGIMLRNAKVAYKTYGQLAADKSNVIIEPSWYSGTHTDMEPPYRSRENPRSEPILHCGHKYVWQRAFYVT